MARYVLIYNIDDFHENGGGTKVEFFKEAEEMHNRVNELAANELVRITAAGFLQKEFEYEPIDIVRKYRPKDI